MPASFIVPANDAFGSFNELIDVIHDWMDRDDLTGSIPSMVALAEDEIRLELEPLFQEKSASVTTDALGKGALPTDLKRLKRAMLDGDPLTQFSVRALEDLSVGTQVPDGYTLEESSIRVWPAGEHTLDLYYDPFLPRLSVTNQRTPLFEQFPSLYFYGAMTFATGYVVDDERAIKFRALFDNMLAQVSRFYTKQKHAGPLVPRLAVPI